MSKYLNPGKIKFSAPICENDGGGAYVEFPHDVESMFGVKGRVPIRSSFDGIEYRGSLVKMGTDCHLLLVLKEIRTQLGKGPGDTLNVEVELDMEERKIELADDVQAALNKSRAGLAFWHELAYTHQREYSMWIESAKKPETRTKRIAEFVQKLEAGKKN